MLRVQTTAQQLIYVCKSDMEADSIDKDVTVLGEAGSAGERRYSLSITGTGRTQTTCDGQELMKIDIFL